MPNHVLLRCLHIKKVISFRCQMPVNAYKYISTIVYTISCIYHDVKCIDLKIGVYFWLNLVACKFNDRVFNIYFACLFEIQYVIITCIVYTLERITRTRTLKIIRVYLNSERSCKINKNAKKWINNEANENCKSI